ncbi:MAG: Flp pilus assembly complex ATPase component TadA [Deltaproteobacteria bacterium]|nr:Flp pilus assembly complex ATPase component TadA [Deltaproteobacteria bacterium]
MIPLLQNLIHELYETDADEVYLNGQHGYGLLRGGRHEIRQSLPEKPETMIRSLQEFALSEGLRLDPYQPEAGGILKDGQIRWHCVIPPAAPGGPVLSVRRHRMDKITMSDFADPENILPDILRATEEKKPLLICGETGCGKTTLLHALLKQVLIDQRLILIEDTMELPLSGRLWTRLLTRAQDRNLQGALSPMMLLRTALRLRPDRLVFGELRAADDMLSFRQALSAGLPGSFATIHAGSAADIRYRFKDSDSGIQEKQIMLVFLERGTIPLIRCRELSAI